MLLLSRTRDEEVILFDKVSNTKTVICIRKVDRNTAVLGIDAPRSVIIDRKEIYEDKIESEHYNLAQYAQ
tara:strand:+ start:2353 stop:2562 length:210 start_codon:yes stop_codon:yes gene_type:complete